VVHFALKVIQMFNVLIKFFLIFLPTCFIGVGGLWFAWNHSGLLRVVGWIVAALFCLAAILQMLVLISGLSRIGRWHRGAEQKLEELEQRDAKLFAEGKSFDEVMSQYKKTPKP
jgi:hypothetical protein